MIQKFFKSRCVVFDPIAILLQTKILESFSKWRFLNIPNFHKFPQSAAILYSRKRIIVKSVLNVHSGAAGKNALVPDSTKRKIVIFSVRFHVRIICEPLSQQIINYSKWSIYLFYCFLRAYPKYLHIFVPTRLMRVK